MKILLIGFAKMKYMPYMNFYLDQIDRRQHEVHVLIWNRDGKPEPREQGLVYHEFNSILSDDIPKYKKLASFMRFRRFALSVLKRERFDFLFLLHSMPAILLGTCASRHFKNRFIFDYRDYTYESNPLFRRKICRAVEDSWATFVSSDAFREALPNVSKIYTSHNVLTDALEHRQQHIREPELPLRISFWGYIRHEKTNCRIISALANDPRFELHYYGREQEIAYRLKDHVEYVGAKNVFFHGEYDPRDRYTFSASTDIIHNIYSNTEAPSQQFAMTNKFYDGLMFYIPQLCMAGSYMGMVAEEKGVGLVCDPESAGFADTIWDYYHNIDWPFFYKSCDGTLKKVMEEYNLGRQVIENAIGDPERTE